MTALPATESDLDSAAVTSIDGSADSADQAQLPTVALVDDHVLVAHTLRQALSKAGVTCTLVVPRPARELLPVLIEEAPELVLLDLDLGPYGSAVPMIAPLADADIRVLVLTGSADRIRQAEALEQGAVGVVTKSAHFDTLVTAVQDAATHTGVRSDPHARELLGDLAAHRERIAADRAPYERLTGREQQTLAALARGLTVQQIADTWVVSETTVRSHVRSILHKLGARSQLQAVVRAVHAGWIDPQDEA